MESMNKTGKGPAQKKSGDSAAYFSSPVNTLLESLKDESQETISTHDMIQAYALLYARVKKLSGVLSDEEKLLALKSLEENACVVSKCLARDIGRSVVQYLGEFDHTLASQDTSISINEEDLNERRKCATLAQQALLLVSEVSSMPEFSFLWTDDDATLIVQSIVTVLNVPTLPTPGSKKTYAFAMWALSLFKIPSQAMATLGSNLLQIIATIVSDDSEEEIMIGDALRILHNLLVRHPAQCLPQSLDLINHVFRHLVSPLPHVRVCAAQALVGLAHAFHSTETWKPSSRPSIRCIIRNHIVEFLDEQLALYKKASARGKTSTLPGLIYAEIPQSTTDEPGPNVGWAFSVLVAVVVLSDGKIFLQDRLLRFTFVASFTCLKHQSMMLQKLHACVRRAFIWAFSRLPYLEEEAVDAMLSNGMTKHEASFHTVKQELPDHHIGSCLMYVLLGPTTQAAAVFRPESNPLTNEDNISRAIWVLRDLVYHKHRKRRVEGVALLSVCTRDPIVKKDSPLQEHWSARKILPSILLSGELLDADRDYLRRRVTEYEEFQPGHVRPFTDTELVQHWEEIIVIWKKALFGEPMAYGRGIGRLARTWHGLLRAKTVTTSQDAAGLVTHVENVLASILDWDPRSELETTFKGNILCTQLNTVRQLWQEATKVLSPEVLRRIAIPHSAAILRKEIPVDDKQAQASRVDMCTELFISSGAECLTTHREDPLFRSKVAVWNGLAESWPSAKPLRSWNVTVALLQVPLQGWIMTNAEPRTWVKLFEACVDSAQSCGVRPAAVLETLLEPLKRFHDHLSANIILALIPHLHDLDNTDNTPITFFKHLNGYLKYPRRGDDTYHAQSIIQMLSTYVSRWPAKHILCLLKYVTTIGDWIRDESYCVTKPNYDSHVIPFYCNTLEALRTLVASPDRGIVQSLDAFLASPFHDATRNTDALHAFKAYWDVIQAHMMASSDEGPLPPGIEKSLGIYYYTFRSERPPFFSEDSVSQPQSQASMSTVPDSQPKDELPLYPDIAIPHTTEDVTSVPVPPPLDEPHTPKRRPLPIVPSRARETKQNSGYSPAPVIALSPEISLPEAPATPSGNNHHVPLCALTLRNFAEYPLERADEPAGFSTPRKRRASASALVDKRRKTVVGPGNSAEMVDEHTAKTVFLPTAGGSEPLQDLTPPTEGTRHAIRASPLEEDVASAEPYSNPRNSLPSPPSTVSRERRSSAASGSDKENTPLRPWEATRTRAERVALADMFEIPDNEAEPPLSTMADIRLGDVFDGDEGTELPMDIQEEPVVQMLQQARDILRQNSTISPAVTVQLRETVREITGILEERFKAFTATD